MIWIKRNIPVLVLCGLQWYIEGCCLYIIYCCMFICTCWLVYGMCPSSVLVFDKIPLDCNQSILLWYYRHYGWCSFHLCKYVPNYFSLVSIVLIRAVVCIFYAIHIHSLSHRVSVHFKCISFVHYHIFSCFCISLSICVCFVLFLSITWKGEHCTLHLVLHIYLSE